MIRYLWGGVKSNLKKIIFIFIKSHSQILVPFIYGDVWKLRSQLKVKRVSWKEVLYYAYLEHYGSWIGLGATIEEKPILPHGLYGIFISHSAHIGRKVVIFHQVTIGSNTLSDSKSNGAPTVADSVYIGCGAKIIGNVHVGKNARIGANCVVVKDVPENSLVVLGDIRTIPRDVPMDNAFHANNF